MGETQTPWRSVRPPFTQRGAEARGERGGGGVGQPLTSPSLPRLGVRYAAGQSWINKQHVIGRAKGSPRLAVPLLVTPLPPHLARIGISFCRLPPVHRHGHYHHERLPARQVCPARAQQQRRAGGKGGGGAGAVREHRRAKAPAPFVAGMPWLASWGSLCSRRENDARRGATARSAARAGLARPPACGRLGPLNS